MDIINYLYHLLLPIAHAEESGVLVNDISKANGFVSYIALVLKDNSWLILTAAATLVVASGVQYMLAVGNSSNQGKAKERIIGIVLGLIFYGAVMILLNFIYTP